MVPNQKVKLLLIGRSIIASFVGLFVSISQDIDTIDLILRRAD
jgi:hypothetical protein